MKQGEFAMGEMGVGEMGVRGGDGCEGGRWV